MKRKINCLVDGEKRYLTDDEISALYDEEIPFIELSEDALFCPCCVGGVIQYRFYHPKQKGGMCNKCGVIHWHTNLHLDTDKQDHVFIKNHEISMVVPLDENRRIYCA